MKQLTAIHKGPIVTLIDPEQLRAWEVELDTEERAAELADSLHGYQPPRNWSKPDGWAWREIT